MEQEIQYRINKDMRCLGISCGANGGVPLSNESVWEKLSFEKQKDIEWRIRILIKSLASFGLFLRDVEAHYSMISDHIYLSNFKNTYCAEPTHHFRLLSDHLLPPSLTYYLREAM